MYIKYLAGSTSSEGSFEWLSGIALATKLLSTSSTFPPLIHSSASHFSQSTLFPPSSADLVAQVVCPIIYDNVRRYMRAGANLLSKFYVFPLLVVLLRRVRKALSIVDTQVNKVGTMEDTRDASQEWKVLLGLAKR